MAINATIVSTMMRKGDLWLRMIGAATTTLIIKSPVYSPIPGQRVSGDDAAVVIDGNGGPRLEYTRNGNLLVERAEPIPEAVKP